MFRRLFYSLLLAVGVVVFWIKGRSYLHDVRIGPAGTTGGLLQLAYLLAMMVLIFIILRTLLRSGRSRSAAPFTGGPRATREDSFAARLHRLQTVARGAFVRSPVLPSALLAVFAVTVGGIPIGLLALGHVGGIRTFDIGDWIVVGVAELPIIFVVIAIVVGFMSGHESSR